MKKKILTICLATTMLFSNMNVSATSLLAKQVEAKNSAVQETYVTNNNSSNENAIDKEETKKKTSVGGMGTILFTVVGISLIAGTVAGMRKNREEC